MATVEDKENLAPLTSSDPLQRKSGTPSPRKSARKGRSKSIGPGGLTEPEALKPEKQDAKNRRKSTYVPATKSILSNEQEKAERQAARRKTLANRRVSFAPEATLHTWDVIEFMRDPTTSTDSSGSTRRGSNFTRASNGGSPYKHSPAVDSDPPSTPPEQEDEPGRLPSSPAPQRDLHQKKRRRDSATSPRTSTSSDDASSPSGISGSSDVESDDEGDDEDALASDDDDDTGTAMSLDVDGNTAQSIGESDSSTGSSARLEAALRQAADAAGTRGIEYDEAYGDASMELAGDEVTNAFKPWVAQQSSNQSMGSASLDQENVNPFSPAFKAQLVSGRVSRPSTVMEEDTGDLSMDVTRAVGGIVKRAQVEEPASSPLGDETMDFTQAVGKIQSEVQQRDAIQTGQKRRRSTAETGSPGVTAPASQPKRRRSSIARSSMGDDTMDLTVAVGGIQNTGSPAKPERRKSVARRRSSGVTLEAEGATMDFTQAVGSIKATSKAEYTASSFDENEELTMELTTVLGGIKAADNMASEERPVTPQNAQSPVGDAAITTPKDQERFKEAPDSGPKKLLTPMFQKQVLHSAEKQASSGKRSSSASPGKRFRKSVAFQQSPERVAETPSGEANVISTTPKSSPVRPAPPSLGDHQSPLRGTPAQSPMRGRSSATPDSASRQQLEQQLGAAEPSPTAQKQQRSSPAKPPATPEKVENPTQDGRRLAESIKLLSTPRKEILKSVTPRKQNASQQQSPPKANTPRTRSTPKAALTSPAKQLSEDLQRLQDNDQPAEKVQLQNFLDLAGIRFMDLTTTKRRMTTATTPSKARKAGVAVDEQEVSLESAVIAGSCTLPELEMYEHACHELKRYISDGKRVIKNLEAETVKDTPPLLRAYTAAGPSRKMALDSQMRDIKTHARFRSKEMWYAWRGQLLDDLMRGLQGIGEGLIRDDESLGRKEEVLGQVVPELAKEYVALKDEAAELEQENAASSEEEKAELEEARERLGEVSETLEEKKRVLEELQREMQESEGTANDLEESRVEFAAAIQEADRVKEACRSISSKEITELKDSVHSLEKEHGWSILSASTSPTTITMSYLNQLKLFFHPLAFTSSSTAARTSRPNAPISLHYTGPSQPLPTTLRFFLQLLQASVQGLPQYATRIPDLLSLVSSGWDTALAVAEAERRVNLETLTEARIVSDERLSISSSILLPKVRSKVRVSFDISASIAAAVDGEDGESVDGIGLATTLATSVKAVYGETFNEKKMSEFVAKELQGQDGFEGWDGVVRALRERLVARGGGVGGGKK